MGSHYDEYYEERDREIANDYYRRKYKEIQEEISKIRIEIIKDLPEDISFKGYYPNLVEKLASCRAYKFKEDALDILLTEIVKELHKR
ncbi:MAG: hypothetical protein EBV00_04390 [Burkholderiaceae bacterium]|jgi:hypothetical protein|nr:hypothetical protein [Burkholderiaceae bacterium]